MEQTLDHASCRSPLSSRHSWLAILAVATALGIPNLSVAQEKLADVFDPFFRQGSGENRPVFQDLPGETVDPFTGTLSIQQTDIVLPGAAGLDLRVTRSYSSKLWGRVDFPNSSDPLLAEFDFSPLGLGWTFHFGRLRDPNVIAGTGLCSAQLPIFQTPDGRSIVFYPQLGGTGGRFVSKEYWRMDLPCAAIGGVGACVWAPNGVRYDLPGAAGQNYFQGPTLYWLVSAVVDPSGNRIEASYATGKNGVVYKRLELDNLTDSYGRVVQFDYSPGNDGDRLTSITVPSENGPQLYQYQYTSYPTVKGVRRFLTSVTSPAGTVHRYGYVTTGDYRYNLYGLNLITYPFGGSRAYTYKPQTFFTGNDSVDFAVVATRTVGGWKVPTGVWTYAYLSPPQSPPNQTPGYFDNLNVTTVTRPDGAQDTFKYYGFGWLADRARSGGGYTYAVGLPYEIASGNRQQIELFGWDISQGPLVSNTYYCAPAYSSGVACGVGMCDSNVYAPARKSRILVRDNPTFQVGTEQTRFFETTFSAFDGYGQPQVVHEAGYNGATVYPGDSVLEATRTTTYTYSHVDDASTHIVLGRPTTKVVCLDGGNDCFTSTWTYDGTGYQKDSESVAGVVTRFAYYPFADSYNGGGNLQSITNAKGQTLTLSGYREQYGVPATLDFNGEFAIRRTASPQGWVLTQTDGRNNTTAKAHDAIGRPTSIVLPSATWPGDSNSLSTLVTYPADLCWTGGANAKCVIQATKGAYVKQTEVDGLGRPIRVSDSQGVTQSFVYNSSGQRTFESYPWDSSTGEIGDFVSYDSLGRSSARSRAYRIDGKYSGVRSDYWFQPLANCLKTTVIRSTAGTNDSYNTVQCEKWFGDLDTGLLWEAVDGTFAAWWYDYNAAGKMTALMAPDEAGDRAFAYDSRQFLASETTGESGTTVNTANQLNQIATRTDARGVVASYDYDATLSRLAGVRYDSSTSESWSQHFDKANNVQDVASLASGAYVFEYDEQNRVRRQTWTAPADWNGGVPVSYVTSFDYDSKGCQIGITYPSGLRVGMTCDTANRVRTVAVNGTLIATVLSYHPTGQIASVRYESTPPLTLTYSYDALGRMASMKDPGVVDLAYGYNGADNLTSLCRDSGDVTNPPCLQTSPPPSLVRTFGYDDANRLLTAIAPSAWGTLVFDYDWLGNRIFKSGDLSTTFVFDRNNRLESAVGPEPLPSMTLTWNAAGRLASSSQDGAAYAYNARGWRVLKKSANESVVYHHDPAGNVLSESTQDGTRQRDFIYLGGRLLLVDSCNPATSPICAEREWYHTDSLGSVLARTNASGAVTTISDYQPWGEGFGTAGTLGDRQYNGRVYDAGTGFHDYGARMYWPQIGRFISADSVMGSPGSPMTLNRYSYVLNNPYKYTDPTGRETQLAVGLNTANNVFGHVAIIINGQVYSYGTNYTQGGKYAQDWGGDASAYLDAQASARQTQLMTLATDAGQESALKAYLDANNPNAKGAPKYDLLSNSCVTASEDALVASGVLPNQIVLPNALNTPPPGSKWAKATTPGDLGSKAKTAGIVKDSKTVGTSAGPTVQSASGTVRAASDRSSP